MEISKPWMFFKEHYRIMMYGNHSDIGLYVPVTRPLHRLEDAIDYVVHRGDYEYRPGKKIAVSYIWAVLAARVYGGDVITHLNDPTLIDVVDEMVLYDDDSETYDHLIRTLGTDPSFIANGWGPWTAFYFWAECTLEGTQALEEHYLNDTLDQFIPENYIEKLSYLWQ